MGGFLLTQHSHKMKKKITILTVFVAIAASVSVYMTAQKQQYSISDITLANIEALADNENDGQVSCTAEASCRDVLGNLLGRITCMGYGDEVCKIGTEGDPFAAGKVRNYVQCGTRKYVCPSI